MKKLALILILLITLAGCAKTSDTFSAYRGMKSKIIFDRAEKNLVHQNYSAAIKDYQALNALYPFGPYSQQGQLDVIYAYYKNDDSPSALAAADRYARLHPRGKYVDYAYYMKALISFQEGGTWLQRWAKTDMASRDIGDKKKAFLSFEQIVTIFPHSPYAYDSMLHMIFIRNMIARKQVLIARYYMKREAYVAAANRASYVVEHFEGSPEVIPALAVMVKAYRKLGLTSLIDNTMKIFQASYPDSKEFRALT